jgi:glycosyltransferase involved in cell wall biosynthesis
VPVYNEVATIQEILSRVQAVKVDKEIIVVDDGSTDGTRDILAALMKSAGNGPATLTSSRPAGDIRTDNIRVLLQDKNRGKGAALRRGFEQARGDIVIVQDADLEYDPEDYQELLAPITAGRADVVYGSRFLGGPHRVLLFWHYVANRFLTTLSNIVTDLNLSDVWTCYKAFRREVLQGLDLRENRFGFEQEITIKVAQRGWRVYETPISYYGRTHSEGKKITWKDGVRALWCILRYSFRAPALKASPAKRLPQSNRGGDGLGSSKA